MGDHPRHRADDAADSHDDAGAADEELLSLTVQEIEQRAEATGEDLQELLGRAHRAWESAGKPTGRN